MTAPVIQVENLSKAYRIGRREEAPDTFIGTVGSWLTAPFRNWRGLRRLDLSGLRPVEEPHPDARTASAAGNGHRAAEHADVIWALKNVSFEVREGEVVGIIGRNGAGKSTLLKLLARITEPTSGRAVIHGRVGSLLEVGTGFHPELTGRDNVYMNGTILGMKKREIDRKFDEIVAFSGVEKFLDTPVKRYSSGMKVRLAFAVAAHLDPEILIVDEVLAVGDAEFQKKCLGKMQDVAKAGRTVLFVSHNMAAVRALCDTACHLASGVVTSIGRTATVVSAYLGAISSDSSGLDAGLPASSACGSVELRHLNFVEDSDDAIVVLTIHTTARIPRLGIGFEIRGALNTLLISQGAIHTSAYAFDVVGTKQLALRISGLFAVLNSGQYSLGVWLSHPGVEKLVELQTAWRFESRTKDPADTGRGLSEHKNGPLFLRVYLTDVPQQCSAK